MTKHKPHIAEDTKGTWTYKIDTASKEDAVDREPAATLEKEQEESDYTSLSVVKSADKGFAMRKIKSAWKPILFSGAAAIFVGSLIGFFIFQMFVQVDTPANGENSMQGAPSAAQTEQEETKSSAVMSSLDSLEMYILQAGIFSEQANADELMSSLTSLNIPSILLEKDSQFFLMAGVGPTEEAAKSLAAILSNDQADLYVKEWSTEAKEIEITEAEKDWLMDFQTFFNDQLNQVDLNQPISEEEINALVDKAPEEKDSIEVLVASLTDMLDEPSSYQLLNWMKVYEEL